MRIIRKHLAPLAAFGFPTRYDEETDAVEASFDGGTTWQAFPEGDPRKNNHTPPIDTDDPKCDAAARIAAETQAQIEWTMDELDLSSGLLPLVTGFIKLFTPLFTLIPYLSLVYTVMQAILTIGATALHTAFDAFDWDEFTCLLYSHLGEDGRLTQASFDDLLADIASTYSDTAETVLYNFYLLAGFGGLNDQTWLRTETGDCAACASCDLYTDTLQSGLGAKTYIGTWSLSFAAIAPGTQGEWIATGGHTSGGSVRSKTRGASNKSFMVVVDLGQNCDLAGADFWFYPGGNTNTRGIGAFREDGTQVAFPSASCGYIGWQHVVLGPVTDVRYLLFFGDCNLTNEQLVRCSEITITPN